MKGLVKVKCLFKNILCLALTLVFQAASVTLHLSLLNFIGFMLVQVTHNTHSSSLSRSSCRVSLPSEVPVSPLGKPHLGALSPFIQITCEDTKQFWAQYQSLLDPTCDRSPG